MRVFAFAPSSSYKAINPLIFRPQDIPSKSKDPLPTSYQVPAVEFVALWQTLLFGRALKRA